jgi:hypothetical protein
MIMRWISDVPSKIVKLVEVRAVSAGRWPTKRPFVSTNSAPARARRRGGPGQELRLLIKPAYYVITNGDGLTVYNYQGGVVPDVKVLEVKRPDLRDRFDDLYRVLNPSAAAEERRDKIARLAPPAHSGP